MSQPACPSCRSANLEHIDADRWRCRDCRWLIRIDEHGIARDALDWTTAGRGRPPRTAARQTPLPRGGLFG